MCPTLLRLGLAHTLHFNIIARPLSSGSEIDITFLIIILTFSYSTRDLLKAAVPSCSIFLHLLRSTAIPFHVPRETHAYVRKSTYLYIYTYMEYVLKKEDFNTAIQFRYKMSSPSLHPFSMAHFTVVCIVKSTMRRCLGNASIFVLISFVFCPH